MPRERSLTNAWDAAEHLQVLQRLGLKMQAEPEHRQALAARLLKVRDRYGTLLPLKANKAQQAFERERAQQNIVLKARQMGMTTWIAGMLFLKTITARGVLTVQVAQTRQAAESIFGIVQRMWENLPAHLREGPLKRSRANVGQMVFPYLDSEFRVWSASDENAGRGLSIQNLHCSEVSRWGGDAAATLAGLRAALTPGGELVLESTPKGAYGAFYDEWQRGVEPALNASGMVRHFLPWWLEPAYVAAPVEKASLTEEEMLLVEQHGLRSRQIGYRRTLERNFGALRSQEFAEDAETCFRATGDCCFEIDAIEKRLAELTGPVESRRNGALQVWLHAQPGRDYIVAVDTAGGGAKGDFATVQVVDAATGMQCAELQEKLTPLELANVSAALAHEYGGALLAVERNNHGSAVLAFLDTVAHYTRLYRQAGQDGWLTSAVSKQEMIGRLGALLVERPQMFFSRRLLGECRTFVRRDHGQTGAANGAHDDLVMSMALAQTVRAERL